MSHQTFHLFARFQGQDLINRLDKLQELSQETTNDEGQTLLHIAVLQRDLALVSYLLKRGFDADQGDHHQQSPLYLASSRGDSRILELLLTYSQKSSQSNVHGESVLMPACQRGLLSVADVALDGEVSLDQIDIFGRHALIHTIIHGDGGYIYQEILRRLLQAGISKGLRDDFNRTALDYAQELDQTVIIQLLEDDPDAWEDGFDEIRDLLEHKKYGTALGKLQQEEDSLKQKFFIGYTYYVMDQYQVAETYIQNIINEDPHFIYTLALMAVLQDKIAIAPFYLELGDVKTKGGFFKYRRVQLNLDLGRYLDAYTLMQELIKDYPDRLDYVYLQATTLQRLGRWEEAIELMERVRAALVQNPFFHQKIQQLKALQSVKD